MAMIECKECEHKVSDRAMSCPNCGAPLAHATGGRGWQFLGGLVTLGVLAAIATVLWPVIRGWPSLSLSSVPALSRLDHPPANAPFAKEPVHSEAPVHIEAPVHSDANGSFAVYQTTAEQLYRDYNANGVATQTRIGAGGIRVSGTIAAIEEDAAGHPVVKLDTHQTHSADMVLTDDQTVTAAQLTKGQNVAIQCSTMHGTNGLPVGSDCALAAVTALLTSPDTGKAAVPTTMATPHAAEQAPHTRAIRTRAQTVVTARATPEDAVQEPVPVPVVAGPIVAGAVVAGPVAMGPTPTTSVTEASAAAPLATAEVAASAPSSNAVPPVPPAPDDLATVRSTDPQAADHIASYCEKSGSVTNATSFTAGCRRDEKAAWTRLVLNHEFPSLDDATRRQCDEPPFPDSYTAKETCARYQLSKTGTSTQR